MKRLSVRLPKYQVYRSIAGDDHVLVFEDPQNSCKGCAFDYEHDDCTNSRCSPLPMYDRYPSEQFMYVKIE